MLSQFTSPQAPWQESAEQKEDGRATRVRILVKAQLRDCVAYGSLVSVKLRSVGGTREERKGAQKGVKGKRGKEIVRRLFAEPVGSLSVRCLVIFRDSLGLILWCTLERPLIRNFALRV